MNRSILGIFACIFGSALATTAMQAGKPEAAPPAGDAAASGEKAMKFGNFSISLAVKDVNASLAFYEKLGFKKIAGNPAQRWVIVQHEAATIGLHQGMFDKNTLTFNPGWAQGGAPLAEFDDVRDIQRAFKAKGLTPAPAADESTSGPAFMMVMDPDGNPILFDQHVPSVKK